VRNGPGIEFARNPKPETQKGLGVEMLGCRVSGSGVGVPGARCWVMG
jgi:hypothetical protein